ncbi:unnamed protein product [Eruca vesicaria subsp. sativa]|uniref:Uncharacterized protein n=1 Tax=Eruca vesicaria subsp. sativa TaxID=29727 RepID=A0ABC8MAD8_ERUVS|nr:unnamed protein product [Eruca vesicaria subsp. sativa]
MLRLETIQGVLVLRPHTPDSDLKREFFSKWHKITGAPLALHTYGLYAYDSVMLLDRGLDKYFKDGGKISFSNDSMLDALGKSGSLNLEVSVGMPCRVSYKEFVSQIRGTENMFKGFCIDVFTAAVNLLPYAVHVKFNPSYTHMVEMITSGVSAYYVLFLIILCYHFCLLLKMESLQNFDGVVGDVAIVTNRTKIVDFTQPYAASGLVVVAPKNLEKLPIFF